MQWAGALEGHFAVAGTQVERFLAVEFENRVARLHAALAADVEDAHLAAREEVGGFERVDGFEPKCFVDGHGAAHDHAVVHRVYHVDFVGREDLFDQKVAAQPGRVVVLGILGMRGIADFVVGFHRVIVCYVVVVAAGIFQCGKAGVAGQLTPR